MNQPTLDTIMSAIGYQFHDSRHLQAALTHPSLSVKQQPVGNYERLEFLGDAVLGLLVREWLLERYPGDNEGDLAKRYAGLVCKETLAQVAEIIGIGAWLYMTESEARSGGRTNTSTLENGFEAILGAIYIDGGLDPARAFLRQHLTDFVEAASFAVPQDPKTALQEWAQARKLPAPLYILTETTGLAHEPLFTMTVAVDTLGEASAMGKSKRLAEKQAAQLLLAKTEVPS
jgi:ribonuclease-3